MGRAQIFDVDVVAISPKLEFHEYTGEETSNIRDQIDHCMERGFSGVFFKFVVKDPTREFDIINKFIEKHNFGDIPTYISPLAGVPFDREAYLIRIAEITQAIMDFPAPNFRLTIQLHKLVGID